MNYELQISERIDDGVRRIATELVENSIKWIEAPDRDRHEAVHEVRKNCKRVRGLLRLIRPHASKVYSKENDFFRDAARSLSGIRDAEAALESYDALLDAFSEEIDRQGLAPVRRALTMHKQHLSEDVADLDARLDAFGQRMHEARERIPDWDLPKDKPAKGSGYKFVGDGLARTYERGREAMEAAYADPSVESFHEWRKRAKYLRYHLRLVRPAWPKLLKSTRSEVKTLGDLLGDDHDLAVLEEVMEKAVTDGDDNGRVEILKALMCQRSAQLRDRAHGLGQRIYAEKPKAFRKRIGQYWTTTRAEQRGALKGG